MAGGSEFPNPYAVPAVDVTPEEERHRARLALARVAVRLGRSADDLRRVLKHLDLIDPGPPGGRKTADGRRVRPYRLRKTGQDPSDPAGPEGGGDIPTSA